MQLRGHRQRRGDGMKGGRLQRHAGGHFSPRMRRRDAGGGSHAEDGGMAHGGETVAAVTCFANTTHAHAHGREKRIFATKSKQKRYEKSIFIALLAVFTAFRLSAQEPTVTTEKHVQKVQTFTSWMELYVSETSPINNPGTVKGVRIEILNATEYAMEQLISLPRADLVLQVAHLLGFARRGVKINNAIDNAITILIRRGFIVEKEGNLVHNG